MAQEGKQARRALRDETLCSFTSLAQQWDVAAVLLRAPNADIQDFYNKPCLKELGDPTPSKILEGVHLTGAGWPTWGYPAFNLVI